MTARDVYELGIALIDEVDPDGNISAETAQSYEQRAIKIMDVLQKELAFYEGAALTGRIESMEDTLKISDDTAMRIMPYGLAANFALVDKNDDMYSDYSYMYRSLIRTIRNDEVDIADDYYMLDGML